MFHQAWSQPVARLYSTKGKARANGLAKQALIELGWCTLADCIAVRTEAFPFDADMMASQMIIKRVKPLCDDTTWRGDLLLLSGFGVALLLLL